MKLLFFKVYSGFLAHLLPRQHQKHDKICCRLAAGVDHRDANNNRKSHNHTGTQRRGECVAVLKGTQAGGSQRRVEGQRGGNGFDEELQAGFQLHDPPTVCCAWSQVSKSQPLMVLTAISCMSG